MSQLIVRNVEVEIVQALKERAARHGRSAEAEHREILRGALRGSPRKKSLKKLLEEVPRLGLDPDLLRERGPGREDGL